MGLGADLVRFFSIANPKKVGETIKPRLIKEFMEADSERFKLFLEIQGVCRRLVDKGVLMHAGTDPSINTPVMGETYYSFFVDEGLADYGKYDFLVYGFPEVRRRFINSVFPIIVEHEDGTPDIGTAFLIEGKKIVTARHCVENMNKISIPESAAEPLRIVCDSDPDVDLAILEFEKDPFPSKPAFKLRQHMILEEVLTMGYPPIPGFADVLVSEVSHLSANLVKTSKGVLVAEAMRYFTGKFHVLMNARVKGGNSGGPVIGEDGMVVGVITDMPSDGEEVDKLGYSAVIPVTGLEKLLKTMQEGGSEGISTLDFTWKE